MMISERGLPGAGPGFRPIRYELAQSIAAATSIFRGEGAGQALLTVRREFSNKTPTLAMTRVGEIPSLTDCVKIEDTLCWRS